MDTITRGRLGYNLLEKELLKRDFEIYVPLLENTKIDCIICKNGTLLKLQIKTIQTSRDHKNLPVRKISHNQGEYKIHNYTSDEIDFFIGADVETDDLYIIPVSIIEQYKSAISITTLEFYKNNFALLEPQVGNNLSGCDDVGETLTGNTEGIE